MVWRLASNRFQEAARSPSYSHDCRCYQLANQRFTLQFPGDLSLFPSLWGTPSLNRMGYQLQSLEMFMSNFFFNYT